MLELAPGMESSVPLNLLERGNRLIRKDSKWEITSSTLQTCNLSTINRTDGPWMDRWMRGWIGGWADGWRDLWMAG